jgi:hypothetical protein
MCKAHLSGLSELTLTRESINDEESRHFSKADAVPNASQRNWPLYIGLVGAAFVACLYNLHDFLVVATTVLNLSLQH